MSSSEDDFAGGGGMVWRPNDPTSEDWDNESPLFGRFMRVEQRPTSRGQCWVAVINKTDREGNNPQGERYIYMFHNVLRDRMLQARPNPGELIGVRFDGRAEKSNTAGNSPPYLYTVKNFDKPAEQEFDWNRMADEAPKPDDASAVDSSQPVHVVNTPPATVSSDGDDIPF